MNVYAYRPDSPNLVALENTLAEVFGRCQRVAQRWGGNFLLVARNAPEPADILRLLPTRAEARFGNRGGLAEWDDLLGQAAWIPEHTTIVTFDRDKPLLTDDHAPLEYMTDRFVSRTEAELLR